MPKPPAQGRTVLRRRSWPVLCGTVLVVVGIVMVAAVWKVTSVNGFRTGWQGIPVYLGLAALVGRVASCKVVLREATLVVINPLRTHTIPRSALTRATVDHQGTLELQIHQGESIPSFAFGGSLVDRVKGTSDEAAHTIIAWRTTPHPPTPHLHTETRWTRTPYADAALALCAATVVVGNLWTALGVG